MSDKSQTVCGETTAISGDEVRKKLRTQVIGHQIYAFTQIGSTNNFARRLARGSSKEGVLVVSDRQTQGRGRLQRTWHSPAGKALYFSLVLRPQIEVEKRGLISLLSAVVVAKVLEQIYGLKAELKWPNDVLLNGRKLCGILLESEFSNPGHDYVIMGLGMNVNQDKGDFPSNIRATATSLRIESNKSFDRLELLVELLHQFEKSYLNLQAEGISSVTEDWSQLCPHLGSRIELLVGSERVEGVFEGLDDYGRMLLKTDHASRVLNSGEVENIFLRR